MSRAVVALTCAMLLALSFLAEAQPPAKVPKIGWLGTRSASAVARQLFQRELRALGYVEGQNINVEYRYAEGKLDRLTPLADELVRLKMDVIVAPATPAALAAKKATRSIPIVFYSGTDPVAAGLVESFARPGGNMTGFTVLTWLLAGKRLELLKESIPNVGRIAALWNPEESSSAQGWKESQRPARELGLQLHSMEVSRADKFADAFKDAKANSTAIVVMGSPLFFFASKTHCGSRGKKSSAGGLS